MLAKACLDSGQLLRDFVKAGEGAVIAFLQFTEQGGQTDDPESPVQRSKPKSSR